MSWGTFEIILVAGAVLRLVLMGRDRDRHRTARGPSAAAVKQGAERARKRSICCPYCERQIPFVAEVCPSCGGDVRDQDSAIAAAKAGREHDAALLSEPPGGDSVVAAAMSVQAFDLGHATPGPIPTERHVLSEYLRASGDPGQMARDAAFDEERKR